MASPVLAFRRSDRRRRALPPDRKTEMMQFIDDAQMIALHNEPLFRLLVLTTKRLAKPMRARKAQ